jgi:hypothetical protein
VNNNACNATRWGAGGGRGREGGSSELMTVLCCGVHHSLQSFLSNYIFIHTIAHMSKMNYYYGWVRLVLS